MKEFLKPNTEERTEMIILGIFGLYFLIAGFILYLLFLHRITLITAVIACLIFTLIYLPRFLILNKIKHKDDIKIIDEFLVINGSGISFSDIKSFDIKIQKPQVIFFLNNKMVVFQEAIMKIKTAGEVIEFKVIGTEKIKLLKEFLSQVIH